jgi:hypothetical protein
MATAAEVSMEFVIWGSRLDYNNPGTYFIFNQFNTSASITGWE